MGDSIPREASLPRSAVPPAAAGGPRPVNCAVNRHPGPEKASVLVAEDHADSRDALRTLLEALGYRVFEAADGGQAVDLARDFHPDLILMDVMMPVVDGLEATRRLRTDPSTAGIPIIALTAMEGSRERALAAGCSDYVMKPLHLSSFYRKLEEWLDGSQVR